LRCRLLRSFVDDATYGRRALECWIMANELKIDVEINPNIGGNFELYEFKAWYFDDMWHIFFLPAIVDIFFASFEKGRFKSMDKWCRRKNQKFYTS